MDDARPIIIKKVKKGGGDGHHGGAWKVAYADFVTAMMAFFLLMWLLNATSEDQRKGLADYFDPSIPISRTSAGGAGMLGGDTMFVPPEAAGSRDEGIRAQPTTSEGDDPDAPKLSATAEVTKEAPETVDSDGSGEEEFSGGAGGTSVSERETEEMLGVAGDLVDAVQAGGQDGLLEHFSMRITPEGLVIEIVDLSNEPLFRSGASEPAAVLGTLIDILVPVLQRTGNDLAIAGHTDAKPFANQSLRSNWELSAERANAARRLMQARGLGPDRIVRVSGRAATDPIDPDPLSERNRRIAITLLRDDANRPISGQQP